MSQWDQAFILNFDMEMFCVVVEFDALECVGIWCLIMLLLFSWGRREGAALGDVCKPKSDCHNKAMVHLNTTNAQEMSTRIPYHQTVEALSIGSHAGFNSSFQHQYIHSQGLIIFYHGFFFLLWPHTFFSITHFHTKSTLRVYNRFNNWPTKKNQSMPSQWIGFCQWVTVSCEVQ